MYYEKRRLFVGIHLTPFLRKRLAKEIEKWNSEVLLPTREQNLHITLQFLGFVQEDQIPDICSRLEEAVKNTEVFDVYFNEVQIVDSLQNPKHIWLSGGANEPLRLLQEKVAKAMGTFVTERKSYRPHVTMAKIKKAKFLQKESEAPDSALPNIKMCLNVNDPVDAIVLFESASIDGKRVYDPLATFPLGSDDYAAENA
jgi:RNA 2',3'-cyclic 3'-phosphodiesterase